MREILFKAKRICSGEWVEGYYCIKKPYCFDNNIGSKAIIITEHSSTGTVSFEVNPDTICQYTGLTDKNGKKIWENDILRGHGNPNDLVKVVFGEFAIIEVESLEKVDSAVGWYTEVIPTDAISKCEPFCLSMPLTDFYISYSELETIGNIFDNPKLLKEE